MSSPSEEVRKFMREIGRKGGQASGETKRRGDSEYYKALSAKAVAAIRARKAGGKV